MSGAICLVTGATGALGPVLVERLLQQGGLVRIIARRPLPHGFFSCPVEVVMGDVGDPRIAAQAVVGIETIFHLAALLHISNPPPEMQAEYTRVNVRATRALVEAAQTAGTQRFVFFSTIAVYGPTPGIVADETTLPQPDTIYAKTKLEAEQLALAARCADGQPLASVLRLAAVYGARMKGNYLRLMRGLARGWFVPIGPGLNRRTLIHEQDAASAALLTATHPQAAGRVFNVTDGQVHQLRDILAAVRAGLNRPPTEWHFPLSWARGGARLADTVLGVAGRRSHPARAMLDKYLEDVAVSGQKLQHSLGFQPQYGLKAGWQQTICEMRRTGQI